MKIALGVMEPTLSRRPLPMEPGVLPSMEQTSEILSYAATNTEVAAAISKLSTVRNLVTVTPESDDGTPVISGNGTDRVSP